MSIYTTDKCLVRLDVEYRLFFNQSFTDYEERHDCENCTGREDKECRLLLENIIENLEPDFS